MQFTKEELYEMLKQVESMLVKCKSNTRQEGLDALDIQGSLIILRNKIRYYIGCDDVLNTRNFDSLGSSNSQNENIE